MALEVVISPLLLIKLIIMAQTINIFTDGACSGNPGPGGWAFAIQGQNISQYGHHDGATNNAEELHAIKEALIYMIERYDGEFDEIIINSDSAYSINAITLWFASWRIKKQTWRPNYEILYDIEYYIAQLEACGCEVKFNKVKGHAGIPENELVDRLAVKGSQGLSSTLAPDPTILITYIATGEYKQYWEGFVKTLDNFFPKQDKLVVVFTDDEDEIERYDTKTVHADLMRKVLIENQAWPLTVLNKFKYILKAIDIAKGFDNIRFVFNFDSKFEFLKEFDYSIHEYDLYAFPHVAWEYDKKDASVYTWGREINPKSKAHIDGFNYIYSQSCIMGGTLQGMKKMSQTCNHWVEQDLMHCIIPMWHDESYWNKYLVVNKDAIFYTPSDWMGEIGNQKACQHPTFNMRNTDKIQRMKQEIYDEK